MQEAVLRLHCLLQLLWRESLSKEQAYWSAAQHLHIKQQAVLQARYHTRLTCRRLQLHSVQAQARALEHPVARVQPVQVQVDDPAASHYRKMFKTIDALQGPKWVKAGKDGLYLENRGGGGPLQRSGQRPAAQSRGQALPGKGHINQCKSRLPADRLGVHH